MNNDVIKNHSTVIVQDTVQRLNNQEVVVLKRKINNLLWEELAAEVTLERAEAIACTMLRLILDAQVPF